MLTIEELKKDRELVNSIEWDMTPELAVRLYLEWGSIAAEVGGRKIRITSKHDYSVYFVVNCWERPFYIYLIRRNSAEQNILLECIYSFIQAIIHVKFSSESKK